MEISAFRERARSEDLMMTRHGWERIQERKISIQEIFDAVRSGEIIEEYPEDQPFPSCLIMGRSASGEILHVVASLDGKSFYLITAYRPDDAHWESDKKTRRSGP